MKGLMKILLLIILVGAFTDCKKTSSPAPDPVSTDSSFAKGADVSWLTEMEASGIKFYNSSGTQQELFLILKNLGMNTIRLRVWVNPQAGWNNKSDVLAKAIRAKNAGMRLLIDFHYSDTWADPGHQSKPAAWNNYDLTALKTAVSNHMADVLTTLKNNGIVPQWVQVGNETNDGMLWPEGKASVNMNNFAQLVNAGYDAVKSVDNSIKVIVHVSNGFDNSLFRWMFDGLKNNGARWDIIGLSLYPDPSNWVSLDAATLDNMNDMVNRYGKEVMLVETGMSWDNPAASKSFLSDIISKTRQVNDHKGIGVLYWEPEAYNNWQGYPLGAFDNSGKPTAALDAFKN
ncbi:MAG: arabinogalactan endo-beta-1,4-galactanase [Flavisolibacter sp.]